jgi:transcriptional regulator with XRE-family HTH domain
MSIYARIKALCKENHISVNKLEETLEISKGSLCKIDTNKPSSGRLEKIADYFGVTVDYLIGREEGILATDEDKNVIVMDDEARELLKELKTRPEMRTLFSVSKKATKEDILKAVKIIEALKGDD